MAQVIVQVMAQVTVEVMAGLVPAISIREARTWAYDRDHPDKPGDDKCGYYFAIARQ